MRKIFVIVFSTYLMACTNSAEFSEATISGLADLPANAVKQPYDNNPDLVKVTITEATGIKEGDYLNGKRAGTWTEYHQTGLVRNITSYVDGVKQGAYLEIDDRGQLLKVAYYHNGELHGTYKEFNRARVKEERNYANGKIEGIAKVYYDNGNIMEEGAYTNGLRHGVSKWYDQEGNITIEYEYKDGELVSK